MTPSEMEEEIKNLNAWAEEISQNLPLLATKDDLAQAVAKLATKEELAQAVATLATKEELAQAVAKLATKDDVESSKRYTEHHILVTRHEIRNVDDKVSAIAVDVRKIIERLDILTPRRKTRKP
jgi:hypothetical protein